MANATGIDQNMATVLLVARQFGIRAVKLSESAIQINDTLRSEVYPLGEKKGCALIMSNSFANCDPKQGKRVEASEKDVENMTRLLRDQIGCELFDDAEQSTERQGQRAVRESVSSIDNVERGKVYENKSASEMKKLLKCFSETKNDYAFIVVVISTHGQMMLEKDIRQAENGQPSEASSTAGGTSASDSEYDFVAQVFLGEDGKPVREMDIIEFFYNDKNPKLRGIPKFFILNYCRSAPSSDRQALTTPFPQNRVPVAPLPLMSDMVTAFATHRSFDAFQDKDGSWLISAIAEVFGQYYKENSVLEMLTKVNDEVKKRCRDGDAMSVIESSLVKRFQLWNDEAGSENALRPTEEATDSEQNEKASWCKIM